MVVSLKPFISAPVIGVDFVCFFYNRIYFQESPCKPEGSLIGIVLKRRNGTWSSRIAELKKDDELLLHKSVTDSKKYVLTGMRKLLLGSGTNSLHARMTLEDGTKLHLKFKGPNRNEWGSRITNCKFPKKTEETKKKEKQSEVKISTFSKQSIRSRPTPVPKPRTIFPSNCYSPPIFSR